jgi:hypothetical protein
MPRTASSSSSIRRAHHVVDSTSYEKKNGGPRYRRISRISTLEAQKARKVSCSIPDGYWTPGILAPAHARASADHVITRF